MEKALVIAYGIIVLLVILYIFLYAKFRNLREAFYIHKDSLYSVQSFNKGELYETTRRALEHQNHSGISVALHNLERLVQMQPNAKLALEKINLLYEFFGLDIETVEATPAHKKLVKIKAGKGKKRK